MRILLVLALVLTPTARLSAQSLFASLTGVVSDPSGAVVPGATVRLINEQSNSARDTVTDCSGYYSFASVAIGDFTYRLAVEAKGFETFEAPGMQLLGGEKRNVNVTLKVGATTQTVEVAGAATSMVPVDSGEKSETLTDQRTRQLYRGGQQRGRVHQDHAGIRHPERHFQQGQLHRRNHRHQRQRQTPAARAR